MGADGAEDGRGDVPVRRPQQPGAGITVDGLKREGERLSRRGANGAVSTIRQGKPPVRIVFEANAAFAGLRT
jgi:hypothetical protein